MDPKFEMIKIMNTKQIYSIETGKLITFYSQITDEMYENTPTPFSDGLTLIEDDFEDDISQMYCIMKDGSSYNMEDFYSDFGAFEKSDRFLKNVISLIADRPNT